MLNSLDVSCQIKFLLPISVCMCSLLHQAYEDMVDHRRFVQNLSSCEINQPNFFFAVNVIRTHVLCDTGAVLYQLSHQANRELFIL